MVIHQTVLLIVGQLIKKISSSYSRLILSRIAPIKIYPFYNKRIPIDSSPLEVLN